jgi:predicted phosphodiesterase
MGFIFLLVLFAFHNRFCASYVYANEKSYYRLVILGDPHLPGKEVTAKEDVIKTINSWNDVDMAVALGDICFELGTADEYSFAKQFFSQLKKPAYFIAGNHDCMYDDFLDPKGKKIKAYPGSREKKLKRFRETFNLPQNYYSMKLSDYLLIFLSTDELRSYDLARVSERQLDWLQSELGQNKKFSTIIFFHAPLKGTLHDYSKNINTIDFIAQPEKKIREVIRQNPQIFLWVSGHTHTPATNESYASEINHYEKQVTNIHNCDMNRGTIWTNSLYLYPDKVMVKTFNHKKDAWMDKLERIIRAPGRQP